MRIFLLLCFVLLLGACGKPEATPTADAKPTTPTAPVQHLTALPASATRALAQWVTQLEQLDQAAQTLAKTPSTAHLSATRSAWQTSYESFNRNLAWLLGNATTAQLVTHHLDPLPIQPGYVDALKEWPDSGLVNDPTLKLDAASLVQQNQATSDTEASLGFQVIQFLLWGNADLPRQPEDFRLARRAQYLTLVCAQLVKDAQTAQQDLQQQGTDNAVGLVGIKQRLVTIKNAATSKDGYLAASSASLAETAFKSAQ